MGLNAYTNHNPALRPKFLRDTHFTAFPPWPDGDMVLTPEVPPCHNSRQFSSKISGYNQDYRKLRKMTAGSRPGCGFPETRTVADVETANVVAGNLRPSHNVHLIDPRGQNRTEFVFEVQ